MVSGLPDYYRGMDVAFQALAQMTVRPNFGGALLETGQTEVIANDEKSLFAIDGKGMIYGGVVWLDAANSQANAQVRLKTDDVTLSDISFLRMIDYGIRNPRSWPVTINTYNNSDYIYSVGISYGVTFESKVEIVYFEDNGRTPNVHYRLVYTLIGGS